MIKIDESTTERSGKYMLEWDMGVAQLTYSPFPQNIYTIKTRNVDIWGLNSDACTLLLAETLELKKRHCLQLREY
jgi:hypothetical protein